MSKLGNLATTQLAPRSAPVAEPATAATEPRAASRSERRAQRRRRRRLRRSRRAVAGLFMTTGVLHFVAEKQYTATVPDYLPNAKQLVHWSGVAEFAGGLGVLIPPTRRAAGLGLLALLVAVFPANINMALHPERWPKVPPRLLWARLPLQIVAFWWVNEATKPRD